MPRRKDDILLKSAFEEAFPDLLRFYFDEADAIFDMDRSFEFLDKELSELFPELEKKGGNRFVDMLVKAFLKDGTEEWILVHLEIEGGNSAKFPARMFQYFIRIYDRYGVDIAALAVFTGNEKQKRPNVFQKSFLGTEICYRYNAYHILDHSEAELLARDNPFSLIVLAAQKALLMGKIPEQELAEHRLTVAKALIYSKKYDHERIVRFLYFLKRFVYIENPEINRNFDNQINKLTGKEDTMGIMETIKKLDFEEGIEKGKTEVVSNLLDTGKFTVSEIANFANVSEAFVRTIKKELKK